MLLKKTMKQKIKTQYLLKIIRFEILRRKEAMN